MLVIADAGRACAIGGVMGGADSEVSGHTRSIVFESAWFKPQSIRATSRRLDLRTEASYRFERGADLTAPAAAMARALALLETTGAGRARGAVVDCHPGPYEVRHVALEPAGIGRLLGMAIPEEKARRILLGLGFEIEEGPTAAMPAAPGRDRRPWRVRVPPWRVDVTRAVDLVEEVGRHHGFEHLPATFPRIEEPPAPSDPRIARDARVRRALIAMGFSEAITFAFIEGAAAAPFAGATPPIAIANPLSEKFTTLRPSLLPGLVDAVSHNRRHGRRDVRLFETGTCFTAAGERRSTAVAWTGLATPDHWSGSRREVDLFDVKGVCEQLCASFDVTPEFLATKVAFLVAGRSADVRTAAGRLGVLGLLQPPIAEARELPAADPVFVLELDLDMLTEAAAGGVRFVRSLPRHPAVVRDVSILIDDALSAATVRGTIRAAGGTTADEGGVPTGRAPLVEVREFDRYRGPGIPAGKISLSLRLTFQALDRTLTDAEVQASMDVIVAALSRELGAVQR
jgi:phenylalanyl-tRNA synthetase beta chain